MKKAIVYPSIIAACAALAIVLISELTTAQETTSVPVSSGPDIIAVASANPDLTTLVSALRAADLAGVLQGRGPFTLFAPNNAAFAKLPVGTLDTLMMPENKKKLVAILQNHVLREKVPAADISHEKKRMLGGGKVEVAKSEGKVCFGEAAVVVADMEASNGVIHVIDAVVMPE